MAKKQVLHIKVYKIPIKRLEDGTVEQATMHLTDDMLVDTEKVELKSPFLELPSLTKKIGQYNKRQLKWAELKESQDYIKKKFITK